MPPQPLLYSQQQSNTFCLYLGEANLYQEKLESFLTIANELRLKGLANDWENPEKNENRKDSKEDDLYQDAEYSRQIERTVHALVPLEQDPNNSVVKSKVTTDPDQLDEQIDSMIEATENFVTRKCGTRQKAFLCNVCGKLDGRTDLKRHIESAHITAITHSCEICGKTSKSRKILTQHKLREHQKALDAFEGANTEARPELSLEVASEAIQTKKHFYVLVQDLHWPFFCSHQDTTPILQHLLKAIQVLLCTHFLFNWVTETLTCDIQQVQL